jgi:hypothetical protein
MADLDHTAISVSILNADFFSSLLKEKGPPHHAASPFS